MKVVNPVKIKKSVNTSDELYQQERLERFFGHNNNMGFFPVGALNCWHGGIHIEGNHAVTAIAKGRVIAYRLAEDYITETYQGKESLYSNSFVLIQHDYKSPKGQELTFYSLYHHLMSVKEMEANKGALIPDFYSKYTAKVKDGASEQIIGLAARASVSGSINTRGEKTDIIPIGYTFELDPLPEDESTFFTPNLDWFGQDKYKKYKRVKFTDINGVQQTNVYAYISSVYSEKISDTKYKVIFPKAKSDGTPRKPDNISQIKPTPTAVDKGVLVYGKPNDQGEGKLLKVVKPGVFGDVEKVDDNWFKVKDKEEYIHKKFLEVTKELKEDVAITNTNKVKNVDFDIEAGTIIGHTGKYAKANATWYNASHIEVFTADSRFEDFFSNSLGDGEQAKVYKTKPGLEFWYTKPLKTKIPQGAKVKVFARTATHVQIGFEEITKIVDETLITFKDDVGDKHRYYTFKDIPSLKRTFNEAFIDEDLRPKSEENCTYGLFYLKPVVHNANNEPIEKRWNDYKEIKRKAEEAKTKAIQNNQPYTEFIEYRKVKFVPKYQGKYWVNASAIPVNNSLPTSEGDTFSGPEEQWVELLEDVSRVYEKKPLATTVENESLATEVEFKGSTATVEVDETLWWKIKGTYRDEDDKLQYKEGWIRKLKETENYNPSNEPDINVFNPFNWETFGWEKEEAPDQYLFQFEEDADAPDFIKKIWEIVDLPKKVVNEDGTVETVPSDKVLSPHELRTAMKNKKKLRTLSHMIVKHHSEWNYIDNRFPSLKGEITTLYNDGIVAAEKEEDKQLLTAVRDEKLKLIEEKTKNLCFWNKITDGEVAEKDRSVREKKETKTESDTGVSGGARERFSFSNDFSQTTNASESTSTLGPVMVDSTQETTEEATGFPPRTFPTDSNVWHFHPIAFINQLKLMFPQGETTGECYCNRDFEAEDLKKIVQYVRFNTFAKDSAGKTKAITEHYGEKLFHGAGGVPPKDRTYERLTKVLNTSFAKFGITNCSHKIHYLANMYAETNYFTATEEFGNNHSYMPYKGRGFQHVTDWNHGKAKTQEIREKTSNYKAYSDAEGNQDIYTGTNYLKVASDIELAADTAGWFWKRANINAEAEKDDIFGTAKKINNPSAKSSSAINGYAKRRVAWIKFKEAFNNYPYNCVTDASKNPREYGEGVLEEMREWADKHIQYDQQGEWAGAKRTGLRSYQTKDALERMDCSEFVCRYLFKLGITDKMKVIVTNQMKTQENFRKKLGNDNIEFLTGSDKSDFIPQAGDIFVWSRSDTDGHTGIVHSVEGDDVTILEAIGRGGSADEQHNRNNGGYEGYNCTRTSVYKRTGGALFSHGGWIGYYRPKNFTKKL